MCLYIYNLYSCAFIFVKDHLLSAVEWYSSDSSWHMVLAIGGGNNDIDLGGVCKDCLVVLIRDFMACVVQRLAVKANL